jgi:thymidylate synthase (FAD)
VAKIKVELVDHMGTDKTVVKAARGSFGKFGLEDDSSDLSHKDRALILMLARGMGQEEYEEFIMTALSFHDSWEKLEGLLWKFRKTPTHAAPFGHCFMSFYVEAPIFVRAQLVKHEYLRMSEVSRRYVRDGVEFFEPDYYRKGSVDIKQGSTDEEVLWPNAVKQTVLSHEEDSRFLFDDLIEGYGVCAEQARGVLPQTMMTRWMWSGSLDAFANMYTLRTDSHAQYETRKVAEEIGFLATGLFPYSWKALTEGRF